jgi:hypothetical protein
VKRLGWDERKIITVVHLVPQKCARKAQDLGKDLDVLDLSFDILKEWVIKAFGVKIDPGCTVVCIRYLNPDWGNESCNISTDEDLQVAIKSLRVPGARSLNIRLAILDQDGFLICQPTEEEEAEDAEMADDESGDIVEGDEISTDNDSVAETWNSDDSVDSDNDPE